jgi:hypothetical protein
VRHNNYILHQRATLKNAQKPQYTTPQHKKAKAIKQRKTVLKKEKKGWGFVLLARFSLILR